jgi:putative ABC transport system permease protein
MKGTVVRLRRGLGVWQGLVVFQVVIAAMLITGTLLINRQLSFMQHRDIGYDADHLLNISQVSEPSLCERLKHEVLQQAHVKAASGVSHLVGGTLYQSGYVVFKKAGTENVVWQRIHTDHDFCRTYNIPIVAGRDFSRTVASDTVNFIVNETACHHLGFKDPADAIGVEIAGENRVKGSIIGVMKDFHFKTLHSEIEPLIIHIVPGRVRMLSVNVNPAQFAQTIRLIEDKWKTLMPSVPFVYTVLGDFNARHYTLERRFGKVIVFFTLIAFFLSVSGLVSLNIYIAGLKKKEIGIRKVLGANILSLLVNLSKKFAFMTALGFVVSIPLSWYAMSTWLSGFAYRVNLTSGLFMIAGVITLILSMVSIAIPSIRAAVSTPADVLKTE